MNAPAYPMVPRLQDWSQYDIVAELRKRGTTITKLSRVHGYSRGALRNALVKPWPAAEKIIAEAIGVHPAAIWPSRYGVDGESNRRAGGVRGPRHDLRKHTKSGADCDTQAKAAA